MYEAIISESKTMFRSLIKPQPTGDYHDKITFTKRNQTFHKFDFTCGISVVPRFKVGEKIYLKEPYYTDNSDGLFADYVYGCEISDEAKTYCTIINKLFMPEKYVRHWIEIVSVKAERLNDISNDDILREGMVKTKNFSSNREWGWEEGQRDYYNARDAFAALWNSINKKNKWDTNPCVWAYSFILIK